MKKELVKWLLGFALAIVLIFVGCRWAVMMWTSHIETKVGTITDLYTEPLCVKYSCTDLNLVEVDGEKYQYLASNDVQFADLFIGDLVRITYRGFRFPLPFITRTISPEITELERLV